MFVLQMGGWLIFACILASFIEHQVHKKLMHRRNFLSERVTSFKRVFEAHTLVHHKHYTAIFSDEPVARGEDKEIRLTVRKAPIKALPFAALIALVSWQGAAIFVAVIVFITGRGTRFIWRCTSRRRGSSAPGRSTSFWRDVTACITDAWTGTSMLCSPWLTMFLELTLGPTKRI